MTLLNGEIKCMIRKVITRDNLWSEKNDIQKESILYFGNAVRGRERGGDPEVKVIELKMRNETNEEREQR